MIIQTNLSALNAHRHFGINHAKAARAQEKLSSGLRINRAGDDAAGLAISEKMRAQVRGLNQASRNAQDGVALIQTAEGALNETHSILQRMRELSIQAATDTYTNSDRNQLQQEVDALAQELTRIAGSTEFNQKKLLNGSASITLQVGANAGQSLSFSIGAMDARSLGVGILHTQQTSAVTSQVTNVTTSHIARLRVDENDPSKDMIGRFIDNGPGRTGYYLGDELKYETDKPEANGTYTVYWEGANREILLEEETLTTSTNSLRYTDLTGNEQTATWQTATDQQQAGYYTNGTLIQAADEAYGPNQTINITLDGAPTSLTGVNLSTSSAAQLAIGSIDLAITRVSSERSKLGATQNRLTHTISNVLNTSENLQAAESRIRDVDMAKEIMELTKHQLLAQASQAMLFQANQAPQQVLQLLG